MSAHLPWALEEALRLDGSTEVVLVGRSMMPWVFPGARLPIHRVEPRAVRPGDVVVIEREGTLVTHRAVRRERDGRWITRGDASPLEDEPAQGERILARVSGFAAGYGVIRLPEAVEAVIRARLVRSGPGMARTYLRAVRAASITRRTAASVGRLARRLRLFAP